MGIEMKRIHPTYKFMLFFEQFGSRPAECCYFLLFFKIWTNWTCWKWKCNIKRRCTLLRIKCIAILCAFAICNNGLYRFYIVIIKCFLCQLETYVLIWNLRDNTNKIWWREFFKHCWLIMCNISNLQSTR